MRRIARVLFAGVVGIAAGGGAAGCRRTHPPVDVSPPPTSDNTAAAGNAAASGNATSDNAAATANGSGAATGNGSAATGNGAGGTTATNAPAGARYAMPDGGTMNKDPRGPRPAEVKAVLDGALPQVQACFDADKAMPDGEYPIKVHFFVENPGYTGAVTLTAGNAPKEVVDCAQAVYQKLRFGEFRGDKLELAPSFTYWKRKPDGGSKK